MNGHILSTEEMINELEKKNIKFNKITKEQAIRYLDCNCNYYNLLTYCRNFQKHFINNKETNKYIDLDFAYLIDLSIIDYKLKGLLYDMLTEVEFYLKVMIYKVERKLVNNGYDVVNKYLCVDYNGEKHIDFNIKSKIGKNEYEEVLSKYDLDKDKKLENIPLWDFMNLITFGELVDFYDFYTKENNLKREHRIVYLLRDLVRLRNGVAHGDLILNNLGRKDTIIKSKKEINNYLNNIGIGKDLRDNKLANSRIRQITSLLYIFNIIVPSNKVKEKVKTKINSLILRIKNHEEYYTNNDLLNSVYNFFLIIIESEYRN